MKALFASLFLVTSLLIPHHTLFVPKSHTPYPADGVPLSVTVSIN